MSEIATHRGSMFLAARRSAGGAASADPKDAPGVRTTAVDPPVFARIYDAHRDFVRRSVARLGIPLSHVEDCTQDVFVTLVRKGDAFGRYRSVRALLYAIARKTAANYRRKLGRQPVLWEAFHTATGADAAQLEAATMVADFLRALDDDKRDVFILAELEGMSAVEISEALGGLNPNTISTRLRAARLTFKKLLEHEGGRHG